MRGRSLCRAAAVVAVATVFSSGCARETVPDPVSTTTLQKGLAEMLAGTETKWIDCPEPLPAKVGAGTRCNVTFKDKDSVTAVLTTIRVDGDQVEWEINGARLSKEQLTERVSAMTGISAVDCDSGLNGQVGSWVSCRATQDGLARKEIVEVTQVNGLVITLKSTPFLPVKQVEDRVGSDLIAVYGRKPDQTMCEEDLPGTVGSVIKCLVTYGENSETWTVRTTGVSGGVINFAVTQGGNKRAAGVVDKCHGCPG